MEKLQETILNVLNLPKVQYPLAIALLIIGTLTTIYCIFSIITTYSLSKKTGKPISWLKVLDDIRWTMYSWDERDKEYVMSLPRLIYFVSAVLIIYVVITNKSNMLAPLLGFNLSSMVSYTGKKYIEEKNYANVIREAFNDFTLEHNGNNNATMPNDNNTF